MNGVLGQLRGRFKVELFLDVGFVGLDGFDAEVKALGDLAGGEAVADHVKHFQFSIAQVIEGRHRAFFFASDQAHHGLFGDAGAEVDFAAEDLADGDHDFFGGGNLHQIAMGSGLEGAHGVEVFVMHGEHEHFQVWKMNAQILEDFDAVGAGEGDIEDDNVRIEFANLLQSDGPFAGGTDDAQVVLFVDQVGDALEDERMIVDQVNPGFWAVFSFWRGLSFCSHANSLIAKGRPAPSEKVLNE